MLIKVDNLWQKFLELHRVAQGCTGSLWDSPPTNLRGRKGNHDNTAFDDQTKTTMAVLYYFANMSKIVMEDTHFVLAVRC